MKKTDDLRIQEINPLVPPLLLMKELPVDNTASELIAKARQESEAILKGDDDRLTVVVGPCSIHDPKAAMEYAKLILKAIEKYHADLQIIMRVYFEKPRTTVGWKGLINDPKLDGSFDINRGLRTARELLLDLANKGVPTGTEFLDTIIPQYIADLISWGAIGARTTESQIHRELASGLSVPVGFKNGTGGSVQIAVDAIGAARGAHHFLSVTKHGIPAIVSTKGNDTCHLILRGSSAGSNHDAESISKAVESLEKASLPPYLMVDCSHGNSRKDYEKQVEVAQELADQISNGSNAIAGVMIESNLVEGNQKISSDLSQLTYGQSVTDSCVNWESTEKMFDILANAVRQRRQK